MNGASRWLAAHPPLEDSSPAAAIAANTTLFVTFLITLLLSSLRLERRENFEHMRGDLVVRRARGIGDGQHDGLVRAAARPARHRGELEIHELLARLGRRGIRV